MRNLLKMPINKITNLNIIKVPIERKSISYLKYPVYSALPVNTNF